jgi:hypothetical protein
MRSTLAVILLAGLATNASAAIVISNVSVSGPLGAGAQSTIFPAQLDVAFPFPAATVGDPVDPLRVGRVIVSFDADGTAGELIDRNILSALGSVFGSGTVRITTTVTDRNNPGVIANAILDLDSGGNAPPQFQTIVFSRGSSAVTVQNIIDFAAPDTEGFDMANISLLEQFLVPSPGALALMGMGGVFISRRRR